MFIRDTALYWNLGMKRVHSFLRKNNFLSFFSNIGVEHYFPFDISILRFSSSRLISAMETLLCTIEKLDVLLAKRFTFDIKLLRWLFMYAKSCNGPKIDRHKMPALISSKWEFWPLFMTLWYLLSRKLWNSVRKWSETLLSKTIYYVSNISPGST